MKFIEAKDKSLSELLLNQRYRIDPFQREYRWQRKHIEALISDLSISFLKNFKDDHTIENCGEYDCYYMGPIVLCDEKKGLSIVDGQQRLTSFTLLVIYLMHAQNKLQLEDNLTKDLKPFLYVTKGGKMTLVLNVDSRTKIIEHLYNNPNSIFDDLEEIENAEENKEDLKKKVQDESIQNITERYENITKLFPEELNNAKVLPLFIEWLLDKVIMVEVKAYSIENAYTIFETMNDRGLSLNPTEILKGFLLTKIEDEVKSDEMNEFWKHRIAEIKSETGVDGDLDFFRAWLRAKYAETRRLTKQGAENEDFEIIGTQFHTWIKNNSTKTFLKSSEDYYFFIRSDFDFFSKLYMEIYSYKNDNIEALEEIYASNFYPIADSLSYPLLLSPISKVDEEDIVFEKIMLVSNFIDVYTNTRAILGKAITQSSIRNSIYELIKTIRNQKLDELKPRLSEELNKSRNNSLSLLTIFHTMDNWGYYHYFFARILFYLAPVDDFAVLLRSRKQSSYVLLKMFDAEENMNEKNDYNWDKAISSVAAFCLVRRYDVDEIFSRKGISRIKYLISQGYLPEMNGYDLKDLEGLGIFEFLTQRDHRIGKLADKIWAF